MHPSTGRADDNHVADVPARQRWDAEIGQHTKTARTHHIAAGFVTGERRFVDQGDPCSAPRKHEGGNAARWTAPDHENVKARQAHRAPFACSDLQ
jgi:hypothetical protein